MDREEAEKALSFNYDNAHKSLNDKGIPVDERTDKAFVRVLAHEHLYKQLSGHFGEEDKR